MYNVYISYSISHPSIYLTIHLLTLHFIYETFILAGFISLQKIFLRSIRMLLYIHPYLLVCVIFTNYSDARLSQHGHSFSSTSKHHPLSCTYCIIKHSKWTRNVNVFQAFSLFGGCVHSVFIIFIFFFAFFTLRVDFFAFQVFSLLLFTRDMRGEGEREGGSWK